MRHSHKPVLIFTWGNPSRGDDAIGPYLHDKLQQADLTDIDLLTDFQLQIEHAVDLEHRERILFIDASTSSVAPFEFSKLEPLRDSSYTTHAMSPEALLSVYTQVNRKAPPPAFMLSVRGYEFELGTAITEHASDNVAAAIDFIEDLLADNDMEEWLARTKP